MDVFNVKPPPPGMIAEGFRCQAEISGFQSVKAKWQVTTQQVQAPISLSASGTLPIQCCESSLSSPVKSNPFSRKRAPRGILRNVLKKFRAPKSCVVIFQVRIVQQKTPTQSQNERHHSNHSRIHLEFLIHLKILRCFSCKWIQFMVIFEEWWCLQAVMGGGASKTAEKVTETQKSLMVLVFFYWGQQDPWYGMLVYL